MASPKVQLIKDFGCGMGSFTTSPAPEAESPASPAAQEKHEAAAEEADGPAGQTPSEPAR